MTVWRRNKTCGRPIRLRWLRSATHGGQEAEFEIHPHGGATSSASSGGRARVVYTDYRSALVYQCLQLMSDGACLPSHVSVEVWSRRPTMPEVRCDYYNDHNHQYYFWRFLWRWVAHILLGSMLESISAKEQTFNHHNKSHVLWTPFFFVISICAS